MKQIFFFIALFLSIHSFAQKAAGIVLKKGQKITVISSSTSDTDMGMGMQMKNVMSTTNTLNVVADDDKNYSISNTITKMNVSVDMMGQQTSYDSEKPEDKDSEIGKEVSKNLNTTDTLFVDKISGNVTHDKKNDSPERPEKTDEANPLAGLMGSSLGNIDGATVIKGAFFTIPKNKKAGDSWTDSTSSEKKMKTVSTYTIKSIDKDMATIALASTITGDGETEMQGTSVSFTMNTKNTGEMTVDVKNGLVNKITSNADITMTMDVMGQSMPISSKANSTITYQY